MTEGSPNPGSAWTVLKSIEPLILQRMLLYQGNRKYYLLGYNGEETMCSLLSFSNLTAENLRITEDPKGYSPRDAAALLQKIHEINSGEGGLQLVCEAFGLLGCFRFLECYYLLLITKRRPLGAIGGHSIYGIADTVLVPLDQPLDTAAEKRYRKLFLSGIDLSKDFFFSYSYNICYTMQYNITHEESDDPFQSMFVWNEFLSREVRQRIESRQWVLPLIHGCWQQRCLSVFGQRITLTLIARRSRRFAGTRYLKRGINQNGWVANEVETEQIVCLGTISSSLSSVVQLRGSIPLFWGQDALTLNPRPNIVLQNTDPLYEATGKHFADLHERYGGPIVVLNLVKSHEKQPRETILRNEFGKAIRFLNNHVSEEDHIVYIPWDFKEHMSKEGRLFLRDIEPVIQTCIASTGLCAVGPATTEPGMQALKETYEPQLQQGVLRTNCIDCLDRTNICQYAYGVVALGHQLTALGVLGMEDVDPDCSLAYQLMEMYETMGNVLSWQYGGSEAHGTFFDRMRGQSEAATQSRDMVTSLKRYYSNTMTDMEKQHAINLFLGNFVPSPNKPALWDFESDHYLHGQDPGSVNRLSTSRSLFFSSKLSISGNRPLRTFSALSCDTDLSEAQGDQGGGSLNNSSKNLGRFPIPKVSQTGDPDARMAPPVEQASKSKKENSWSFSKFFRTSSDNKVEFRPPDRREGSLVSFDEMMSTCPVIHVRLHDSQSSTFRGLRGLSFHRSFTRIAEQDAMLEVDFPSHQQSDDIADGSLSPDTDGRSNSVSKNTSIGRVTSFTKHAKTGLQALKERSKKLRGLRSTRTPSFSGENSESKLPLPRRIKRLASFPRRAATPPSGAYGGYKSIEHPRHSGMTPPASARGSIGKRSAFAQTPPARPSPTTATKLLSTEMAPRYFSVPMGVHDLEEINVGAEASIHVDDIAYDEVDTMEQIWSDYWSITPESVAAQIAMGPTHNLFNSIWDVGTNVSQLQQGSGWSPEDCWNDVFVGSLDSFALRNGQLKRSLAGRPQLQKLSLSRKSVGTEDSEENVEVSITDSYYPETLRAKRSGEASKKEKDPPLPIERKSVTFVDSSTNAAPLEKWWGTN